MRMQIHHSGQVVREPRPSGASSHKPEATRAREVWGFQVLRRASHGGGQRNPEYVSQGRESTDNFLGHPLNKTQLVATPPF